MGVNMSPCLSRQQNQTGIATQMWTQRLHGVDLSTLSTPILSLAQGRPECSRCPVCSCAVLFAQIARETAGAASTRSSLRPLIFGEGKRTCKPRAISAARSRNRVRSGSPGAGLQARKMDCFASLAMTGLASADQQKPEETPMLTLHHLNNSRSQRVLWLLEELGTPYEIKRYQRDAETRLAPPELKEIPSARQVARHHRRRRHDRRIRRHRRLHRPPLR